MLDVFRPELVSGPRGKQAEAFLNYNLHFRPALVSHHAELNLALRRHQPLPERVLLDRAALALAPPGAVLPVPLPLAGGATAGELPLPHPRVGGEELVADLAAPSTRHGRLRHRLRPAHAAGLLQVSRPRTGLRERLSAVYAKLTPAGYQEAQKAQAG